MVIIHKVFCFFGFLSIDSVLKTATKMKLSIIEKMKKRFEDVVIYPGEFKNPYVTSHENNLIIFICKNPKIPYAVMLDKGKFYY